METCNKKTAIVCSNGGMRCSYSAGFLYTLATKFGITEPDIMVGSSGGAGNVMYFCAGDYEHLKQIWTEELYTPDFISYMRVPVMNINYLIDTVFKKSAPLNTVKLNESKIEYFMPIVDIKNGEVLYAGRGSNMSAFEIMRAAKSMPILCNGSVRINDKSYMDGGIAATLHQHVETTFRKGATHVLVINTEGRMDWLTKISLYLFALVTSRKLYALFSDWFARRKKEESSEKYNVDAKVITIKPPRHIQVGLLTRNKEKLQEAFTLGVEDALARESELREFFAK